MAKFRYSLNKKNLYKSPIMLSVSWGGGRVRMSTGITVTSKYWDQKNQKVKPSTKEAAIVNPDLKDKLETAQSAFRDLVIYRKDINENSVRKALKNALDGNITDTPTDFHTFVNNHILELSNAINPDRGTRYTKGTISGHRQSHNVFKAFELDEGIRMEFDSIDMKFYNKFLNWAYDQENTDGNPKYGSNTLGKHIKNLKAWLNAATDEGINKNYAFKKKEFKKPSEDTITIALTQDELTKIKNLDLKDQQELDLVRDAFLVAYMTSLRFSDFSMLDKSNIVGDQITIISKKTGKTTKAPITADLLEMIDKYNGSFPKVGSNQHCNRSLKTIGKLAGIDDNHYKKSTRGGIITSETVKRYELITTHTARRSFATIHYKEGTPLSAIRQATGHSTDKQLFNYIKINEQDNLDIIKAQSSKLFAS